MGTLTVDDAGRRRELEISDGALTVGSGPEADLVLAAPGVAAVHADLDVDGADLWVAPRPGATPPLIDGTPAAGRTRVAAGGRVAIGGAELVWRGDGAPPRPKARIAEAAPAPAAAPAMAPASAAPARGARRKGQGAGRGGGRRSRGERARGGRPSSGGVPPLVVVVGALVLLGGAGYFFARKMQGDLRGAERRGALSRVERARDLLEERNFESARSYLAEVDRSELDAAGRALHDTVSAGVDRGFAERAAVRESERGEAWFEAKLEGYADAYLGGSPQRAEVRVFLERCAEFRERWPDHARIDWIERQERRFAGFPGLDGPPTFDDVAWKARVLTEVRPRDYAEALGALAEYRADCPAAEAPLVDGLVAKLVDERAQYHRDQLRTAQAEWDKGNRDRAFEWLVQSIIRLGDEAMAAEAASILVQFPGADALLSSYRAERPDDFALLTRCPVIAEFAAEKGV